MLTIIVPPASGWDEELEEFVTPFKGGVIKLEHSLISVKKWEAKHHVPFLDDKEKSAEDILDYIKCMTISITPDDSAFNYLTKKNIEEIMSYMENPMTATWFSKLAGKGKGAASRGETITAELVYYWMISYNIPVEFEKWHLNQLMTLIKVFSEKNRKVDPKQAAIERARLNEERKRKFKTKG